MRLGLNTMRFGLNFGFWGATRRNVEAVQFAEKLGFDSVWTAEAYGSDAITPLTWLAAHTTKIKLGTAVLQIAGRSPAMTAMTAASLDMLSNGRFMLGLGISGPQVVEGWHNEPFNRPLEKTREYVTIVRSILRRGSPVEFHGKHYDLPYQGEGSSGFGKPMKLMLRPRRSHIPLYLAAMGPRNVAMAFEIADGWLPLFFSPFHTDVSDFVAAAVPSENFEIAPFVPIVLGPDVDQCRKSLKPVMAFWLGGMGHKDRNFYNDLACRFGYEVEAKKIQELYLQGRRNEAALAVPDALVDDVALCGPRERIAERIEPWKKSPVTTMICGGASTEAMELMAELVL